MHVCPFDYLAVGIGLLKCQCSFVDIWSISINSSHVTGPHLKATLSLWKHQTNLRSCQIPEYTEKFCFTFPHLSFFQIHMANIDGFASRISPLPTNPFGYDGLQI